jgi:hypothetical protein
MNEATIAHILRAAKPVAAELQDGWVYTAIRLARQFQAMNPTLDALAFFDIVGVSSDDQHDWRSKFDEGGTPKVAA